MRTLVFTMSFTPKHKFVIVSALLLIGCSVALAVHAQSTRGSDSGLAQADLPVLCTNGNMENQKAYRTDAVQTRSEQVDSIGTR